MNILSFQIETCRKNGIILKPKKCSVNQSGIPACTQLYQSLSLKMLYFITNRKLLLLD